MFYCSVNFPLTLYCFLVEINSTWLTLVLVPSSILLHPVTLNERPNSLIKVHCTTVWNSVPWRPICVLSAVTFKPRSVYTLSLNCIFHIIFKTNNDYFHQLHFVIIAAECCSFWRWHLIFFVMYINFIL